MVIHAVNIKQALDKKTFDELLSYTDRKKKSKILSLYHNKDRQRGLVGDILVRMILSKRYNIKNSDIVFYYNQYGKPYLDCEGIYFNISHSGDWVVCVFDQQAVGIDIELINEVDLDSIKRFILGENENITFTKGQHNENNFYELWTLKEAYIKAIGKGLSIPLNSFMLENVENNHFKVKGDDKFFLKRLDFENNYKMAFCATKKSKNDIIIKYNSESLYKLFLEKQTLGG
ncbi:4'-phosphopantetheinyl transferase family protein [Salibacterium sp. K-3]